MSSKTPKPTVGNVFPSIVITPEPSGPEENSSAGKEKPRSRRSSTVEPPVPQPNNALTTGQGSKPSSSKLKTSSSSSSLSLQTPGSSADRSRRTSDVQKPDLLVLNVPDKQRRRSSTGQSPITSAELVVPDKHLRRTSSCVQLSKEDLRSLREMKDHVEAEAKPDVKQLHSILRSEYEKEKHFKLTEGSNPIRKNVSAKSLTSSSDDNEQAGSLYGGGVWREKWRAEKAGDGAGEIRCIRGMCFTDSGELAVSEEKNSRVQIFNSVDGRSLKILKTEGQGQGQGSSVVGRRMQPAGIALMPQRGLLAVADLNRVVFFDPSYNGHWNTEAHLKNKTNLHGMAVNARGNLILTDVGTKPSVGLYETEGKLVREFKADFKKPLNVTVSHEYAIIFVSDSELGCVYLFDQEGRLLSKIGQYGSDTSGGRLVYPQGLCCLSNGQLVVADRAQHRLPVYDVRNRSVEHLLTEDDGIKNPVSVAVVADKYLAVSEENYDFKVNEYKLKMFRRKRRNNES